MTNGKFVVYLIVLYGGVPVSTGMLKYGKRVAAGTALKAQTLKLNANKNLAYAA